MRELQARQQFKKRLYSLPALCVLVIITILIIHGAYGVYQKKVQSAAYVTTLEAQVASLKQQNADLTANLSSIATPEGVEKAIKEKFNVTAPGEQEAIFIDPASSTTAEPTDTKPWYERLWGSIMGAL